MRTEVQTRSYVSELFNTPPVRFCVPAPRAPRPPQALNNKLRETKDHMSQFKSGVIGFMCPFGRCLLHALRVRPRMNMKVSSLGQGC